MRSPSCGKVSSADYEEIKVPSIRTFVAVELPSDILDSLAEIQERLRRGPGGGAGRWVRQEGIHLTLKFLGEVPSEKLQAIYQTVVRVCAKHNAFTLRVGGLGCFPNVRRPRVVWVGVHEETGQLAALQKDIEHGLAGLGFPPEGRAFTPHLTLARVAEKASRQEVEALGKAVSEQDLKELAQMRVTEVSVMKSDLRPEGAFYTELFKARLGV